MELFGTRVFVKKGYFDLNVYVFHYRSTDRTVQGAISSKELPPNPGPRDIVKVGFFMLLLQI